jgi:hypothetical protein
MTEKLKRSLKGTPAAEVLKSIVRRRPLSGQSHIEVRNKTYS